MTSDHGIAPVIPIWGLGTSHDDEFGPAGRELSQAILAFVLRCKEVGDQAPERRDPQEVEEVRLLAVRLAEVCDRCEHASSPSVLRDAVEGARRLALAFLEACEPLPSSG